MRSPKSTYREALPATLRQTLWLPLQSTTLAFWPCTPQAYTTFYARVCPYPRPDGTRWVVDGVSATHTRLQEE